MPSITPRLFAVLLLWLYGWRLALAIILSVTLIPFAVTPLSEIYDRVVTGGEAPLPFNGFFVVAGLIVLFGRPLSML